MRLHLIHSGMGLKRMLDKVMTAAQWNYVEPLHMKKASAMGKTTALFGQLVEYLRSTPEAVQKVSTRVVKDAMQLADDDSTKKAFSKAVGILDLSEHGWTMEGRSLVRGAIAFGFAHQT